LTKRTGWGSSPRTSCSGRPAWRSRGCYRDPESQAFIESWFGKLKEREVWLNEYETLDDARRGIGGYVDRYHQALLVVSRRAMPSAALGSARTQTATNVGAR
jgi:hypothetical protein